MMCVEDKTAYVVLDSCTCLTEEDKHVCADCMTTYLAQWPNRTCMFCRKTFAEATRAHVSSLTRVFTRTREPYYIPLAPVRPPDEVLVDTLIDDAEDSPVVYFEGGVYVTADGHILSEDDEDDSDADEDGNLIGFIESDGHIEEEDNESLLFTRLHTHLLESCG